MTDLISYSFNVTPMSFCNTIYINTHIDTHTGSQGKLFFFFWKNTFNFDAAGTPLF